MCLIIATHLQPIVSYFIADLFLLTGLSLLSAIDPPNPAGDRDG